MIGFNNKKEVPLLVEESAKGTENTSAICVMENESIEDGAICESQTALEEVQKENTLTNLLGKSKESLKKEFYQFQLSEIVKKLGNIPNDDISSNLQVEEFISACLRNGINEIIVNPFELAVYKGVQKKRNQKGIKFLTMVDNLSGEGNFKATMQTIKCVCKGGTDYIVCPFTVRAYNFAMLGEFKRKMVRLVKSTKKPVFISINTLDLSVVKKVAKALDGVKFYGYMIVSDQPEVNQISQVIEVLKESRLQRNIYLQCKVEGLGEFVRLNKLSLNKIFSPYANKIFMELCAKLNVH